MMSARPPPRLLAVDLDGTLLNPDSEIDDDDADALRRAAAGGMAVLIATGRGHHSVQRLRAVLEDLAVPAYLALHNGALVLDPSGAELWRTAIGAEAVAAALPLVRGAGLHPMLYVGAAGGGGPDVTLVLEHAARRSPRAQFYLRTKNRILEVVDDVAAAAHRGVLGIVSFGTRAEVVAGADALARLDGRMVSWWGPFPSADALEAVAPGGTKGRAVQRLAERLGLAPRDVLAIGDNSNDLDMLRYAGTAVAMGNATPEVRAAAHFVTASNAEAGVAAALKRVLGAGLGE
ncbi:MAG: Cof-type HAD-IIB family hydrolase [Spirochaetaceae bacterium]|nr:Cof-type HAD-IIB family hydrolase [Spirochaetaceae bacterium]